MKARIVEQLGETAVLMPTRIAEGLAANDRAKARMSALQAVAKQAAHPGHEPDDLSAECAIAGIDASEIQVILARARASAPGVVVAPGLARLINALFADIDAMIAAATVGDQAAGAAATKRLSSLKAMSVAPHDEIESSRLSALSALPADGDSAHRLVMDVHKVLNRLAAACAEENVAGAHAHGVLPGDRPMPDAHAQLRDVLSRLERHFGDVQDVEFTIEDGKFWILQTRAAKRTPRAALRFAVDFVRDGLLSPVEAAQRLEGLDAAALAITHFGDAGAAAARGTGASAGVAVGRVAFDSSAAQVLAARSEPVILVRPDANTADVAGFSAAAGVLTAAGGRTAHAALVARHMGKPCIVGCRALSVNSDEHRGRLGDTRLAAGDWIAVDGGSGEVFLGRRTIVTELPAAELKQLETWRACRATPQVA